MKALTAFSVLLADRHLQTDLQHSTLCYLECCFCFRISTRGNETIDKTLFTFISWFIPCCSLKILIIVIVVIIRLNRYISLFLSVEVKLGGPLTCCNVVSLRRRSTAADNSKYVQLFRRSWNRIVRTMGLSRAVDRVAHCAGPDVLRWRFDDVVWQKDGQRQRRDYDSRQRSLFVSCRSPSVEQATSSAGWWVVVCG